MNFQLIAETDIKKSLKKAVGAFAKYKQLEAQDGKAKLLEQINDKFKKKIE